MAGFVLLSLSSVATAQEMQDEGYRDWLACVYEDKEDIAKQPGSPVAVATAALQRCGPDFDRMFEALMAPPHNMNRPAAIKEVKRRLQFEYDALVSAILGLREEQQGTK
jgi:hypothetical protein